MPHLDEGTIHAWLDGALSPDESARVEAHAAECATCAAAVAEARGLIAASSRILTALDDVPGEVVPSAAAAGARDTSFAAAAAARARRRPPFRAARYASIAAVVAFVAVTALLVREKSPDVMRATSDVEAKASESATLQSAPADAAASAAAPAAAPATAPAPVPPTPVPTSPARIGEGAGAGRAGAVAGALRAPAAPELADADKQTAAPNEERSLRASEAQRFGARQEAAAPAPPSLTKRAAAARGVEMDSRVNIAQINGRVTDSAGTPIASAQVTVVGTTQGALTKEDGSFRIDNVPAGTQTLNAAKLGYVAGNKQVETNAGDTVSVDLSLANTATQLSEVIVAGAATSADEFKKREVAGLTLLSGRDTVENGRRVRHSVYQLRPGVTITLLERRTTSQAVPLEAAPSRRSAPSVARARTPAAAPERAQAQAEAQNRADAKDQGQINTIFWTGRDGTEYTLSGPLPVAELEEVRRRIERR